MPISGNIVTAIEQLRPEFPALLGNDSNQFMTQLEAALARGDEDQVLELFEEKYPVLNDRLLDLLGQQGRDREANKGGLPLPGNPIAPKPDIRYKCKIGPHFVYAEEIQERNAADEALCPQHYLPMTYIRKR